MAAEYRLSYTASEIDQKLGKIESLAKKSEIPTSLSDLTDDVSHRTVTDAEKVAWNSKSNFSGSYKDLTDKPNTPNVDEFATKSYVEDIVDGLVGTAPDTLNTIDKLAAALNNDENFFVTVDKKLGGKANSEDLGNLSKKNTVEKTDLSTDVQALLNKADSALQSYTETDPTVPDWAKNSTKPGYTAEEVGADSAGTANNLVSTHNIATDSHSDIREQLAQLEDQVSSIQESGAEDGEDGGFYTPIVSKPDDNTLSFTFVGSKSGMVSVPAQTVSLPSGKDGADGGYYTPSVTQPDANTMIVSFSPSKMGMDLIPNPKTITLPSGKDGTSVTISAITESSDSGGSNVVTFSDGKTLEIKNGKDGKNGEPATIENNMKSVKDYGATGDGVTDDTDAIAAAIADLNTGDTLYFPEGVYRVSNIDLKSNMIVQGSGWCSVIKLLDNTTDYNGYNNCLDLKNVNNIIIRDIKLDGNRWADGEYKQQSTAHAQDQRLDGIHMWNASDIYVENVWMYNNGYHGCIMVYATNVVFEHCKVTDNGFRSIHGHTKIYNCRVSNCVCENNGLGLQGGSGYENDSIFFFGAQHLVINDNIIKSNRRGCITVGCDQDTTSEEDIEPSYNVTISGNVCECYADLPYVNSSESDTGVAKYESMGIMVYGAAPESKYALENVTIVGNTIWNAHHAIRLYSQDIGTLASINATVTGNTILKCSYGIHAKDVEDITISGNQFRDLKEAWIYATNLENCLIYGNNINTMDVNQLCKMYSSKNVVIRNNNLVGNQAYAIYIPASNTGCIVMNNTMHGFTLENPITNPNGYTAGNLVDAAAIAQKYSITANLTNCTGASGNTNVIAEGDSVSLAFTADSGYALPAGVVVSGAAHSWTQSAGVLVLSNPTGNVTITIVCESSDEPDEPKQEIVEHEFVAGFVRANGSHTTSTSNYKFTDVVPYHGGDLDFRAITDVSVTWSVIAFYNASYDSSNPAASFLGNIETAMGGAAAFFNAYNTQEYANKSGDTDTTADIVAGTITAEQIATWYPDTAYIAVTCPTNASTVINAVYNTIENHALARQRFAGSGGSTGDDDLSAIVDAVLAALPTYQGEVEDV